MWYVFVRICVHTYDVCVGIGVFTYDVCVRIYVYMMSVEACMYALNVTEFVERKFISPRFPLFLCFFVSSFQGGVYASVRGDVT